MDQGFPSLMRPKQLSFDRILKDYENPMSVINLVPNDVAKCILAIPDKLLDLEEEELEKLIPEQTATVNQLRAMFWTEYDRAQEFRMRMDMSRVYVGSCNRGGFYKICHDPEKLAWIVTPPKEYTLIVDELLTIALKQVRSILKLPLKNELGYTDTKLADVQLKAAMMLDMRQKGGYIHRSMQINQNLNTNETKLTIAHDTSNSSDDVDSRIKLLEEEIAKQEQKMLSDKSPLEMPNIEQNHRLEQVTIEAKYKEIPNEEES
jgi:hypothetical protein